MIQNDSSASSSVRLDVWLYSVRIFKTRFLAKEKCSQGHVKINDQKVKASHKVRAGVVLSVKDSGFWRSFLIIKILKKRVSAKLAIHCFEDKTNKKALKEWQLNQEMNPHFSKKGSGRPTKKQRQNLDQFRMFFE